VWETLGSAVPAFLGGNAALCLPSAARGWVPVHRRAGGCSNVTWREGSVLLQPCFPQSSGEQRAWLASHFLPRFCPSHIVLSFLLGWCYGLAWQGFGSGGAIGVASVRSCEKLPPCLIEPVPAGSK